MTTEQKKIELPALDVNETDMQATMEWTNADYDFGPDCVPTAWFVCRERQLLAALTRIEELESEVKYWQERNDGLL